MKRSELVALIALLILFSCDKFEYSHYQVSPRDDYREINQRNIARLMSKADDTIRIAVIGDSQRYYGLTENVISEINSLGNIDFVIHTGDLTDFGLQREYEWMHEELMKLNSPYLAVIGNHDLVGNGGEIYKLMYGDFNFSFTYMGNKFIFINTNSREYSFNGRVPDIQWLDHELADTAGYQGAYIVCHVPPFDADFDPVCEFDYTATISRYGKTNLCINGHRHSYYCYEHYNDGVLYLNSYSTSHNKFVLLRIWNNSFSVEPME